MASPSSRSRRRRPPYLTAVLCLVTCAAFIGVVYFLAGDRGGTSATAPTPTVPAATDVPTPVPTPTPPPPTVLEQTEDAGQEYIDSLYFLGDSITYQLASNHFVPFTQVWVPKIGTLSLFSWAVSDINYYPKDDPDNPREMSIADTAAACKPEYLVITLGINGVAVLDEEDFKDYYRDLINTILENSPDTKIICQSIFPVVESLTPEGITNANVEKGNQWILDVAKETGTRYLNTHEVLTDSSGGLIHDYSPWDGYHVTTDAYEVILQYIRTHAYR